METAIDLLDQPARSAPIAVVDLEMTGLDIEHDRVIEVAAVRAEGTEVVGELNTLLRVDRDISKQAREVTGITATMLAEQPVFEAVAPALRELLGGAVVVAHNVPYDVGFLEREFERAEEPFSTPASLDTLMMARRLFAFRRNDLGSLCESFSIELDGHHRALADARATFALYHHMLRILDPEGEVTVREVQDLVGALAPNTPLRLSQKKMLRDALRHGRTLVIDYQSTSAPQKGAVRREIGVWMLNLPYIQAWCYLREGERVFRLDRIRQVLPGGRHYEVPAFDPRI